MRQGQIVSFVICKRSSLPSPHREEVNYMYLHQLLDFLKSKSEREYDNGSSNLVVLFSRKGKFIGLIHTK